jgi:hypothetical protein
MKRRYDSLAPGFALFTTLGLGLGLGLALSACGGDDTDAQDDHDDHDDHDDETGDGDGDPTTGDGDGDPTTGDGDGDPTTGDGDGDPTGDGDGDGDGDTKPNLGDTPNVLCEAAIASLDVIKAELASESPDAMVVEDAYVGTALQEFVQLSGAVTGRIEDGVLIDDAAILASLDAAADADHVLDLIDVEWRVYLAMQQYIRTEVTNVSEVLPDPNNDPALLYQRWDATYCYWDGALRPLAQLSDGLGVTGDTIEADIDAGFEWGHAGIEGEQPWAIDEFAVPPAKQQVEKSIYTVVLRLVAQWSADAAAEADEALALEYARMAYGAYQIIEDRINTKNTPSIAVTEAALLGDPADIDAEQILDDMAIAFVKRTRRYTDLALPDVGDLMGTAAGLKGAVEGAVYSKSIEPYMVDLQGFDIDAYRATWATYIEAVENDDLDAGAPAAAELTDWNCQFQTALGLAECSYNIDET